MHPRTNGHEDHDRRPSDPTRPRLPADGRALRPSSVDSLRAADRLARLEARIREFHSNLDSLESAEPKAVEVPQPRSGADSEDAESAALAGGLVRRAATAARLAVSSGESIPLRPDPDPDPARNENPIAPPLSLTASSDTGQRRRRADRAEGAFTSQRRIDALRPDVRSLTDDIAASAPAVPEPRLDARAFSERTRRDAESHAEQLRRQAEIHAEQLRREAEVHAEQLRREAESEADRIRSAAELEMQELWQALESEVEAIQTEISHRVDSLADRIEAVSHEADDMRARAEAVAGQIREAALSGAEQIREAALTEAEQIRDRASDDAEDLLTIARREARTLIAEARTDAETLVAQAGAEPAEIDPRLQNLRGEPAPHGGAHRESERSAAERIAEQIRDATAALTRRVSRAAEDLPHPTREVRGPSLVPGSIREVLDGLLSAVSLIERSLSGLAELLGDSLGAESPDER